MTGAGFRSKRLDVDEDFLTAVGRFDEAETAVVVPGFEGSGELHEDGGNRAKAENRLKVAEEKPLKINQLEGAT